MKKRITFWGLAMLWGVAFGQTEVGKLYYKILDKSTVSVVKCQFLEGDVTIPQTVEIKGNTYTVTSIWDWAFRDCKGLTSITIPNSVTSIWEGAFYGCSGLTSITIPNSVKSIEKEAFYGCKGLTSITIPNSVKSIGEWAFSNCDGLTSITIPNSVKSIGKWTFRDCGRLAAIKVETGNQHYTAQDGVLYSKDKTLLHTYPAGKVGSFIIPGSVTSIEKEAFYGCEGLTSITIPNSVTSIGEWAFSDCYDLTNITIPNSVTSIGKWAFRDCKGLTSITIPNSVTSIGPGAFYRCSGLTSITIPNSVTSIGPGAFLGCSGLTSITIPNSVTSIGEGAFSDCYDLTSITISNSVKSIGERVFSDCYDLTSITIPNSVKSIEKEAFYGCKGLTSITIPNSVKSIEDRAFADCSSLVNVTVNWVTPPSGVAQDAFSDVDCSAVILCVPKGKAIEQYKQANVWKKFGVIMPQRDKVGQLYYTVLDNNTVSVVSQLPGRPYTPENKLKGSVSIPNTVQIEGKNYTVVGIESAAFHGCDELTSITIPSSVTRLGGLLFDGCSTLKSVYVNWSTPSSVQISDSTFGQISLGEITLYVPEGTENLYKNANGWKGFKSIIAYKPR